MEPYDKLRVIRHLKSARRHYEDMLKNVGTDQGHVRQLIADALEDCNHVIKWLDDSKKETDR